MAFWLSIGLGGILAGILLGLSIGLGAWLGYGYWQARADRKIAEIYAALYKIYYAQEKRNDTTGTPSEVQLADTSAGPRDDPAHRHHG
jgi:hypothetical protein